MENAGQALPGVGSYYALFVVECIHHLRRVFVGPGNEDVLAAEVEQAPRALVQIGIVILVGVVLRQAPGLEAVGCDLRGLRNQQLPHR